MISKAIIEAVIKQANSVDKDMMLRLFIVNLGGNYSYNDNKVNHCLELLLGETERIFRNKVNIDYIEKNLNKYIYNADKYIIKDIKIKSIDDIEGIICLEYKSKEKINEDNNEIGFNQYSVNISFIDNPEVLK